MQKTRFLHFGCNKIKKNMSDSAIYSVVDGLEKVSHSIEYALEKVTDKLANDCIEDSLLVISENMTSITNNSMSKQMTVFVEEIENAIAQRNGMETVVQLVKNGIIQDGYADIQLLDIRMRNKLRKNYPICCTNVLSEDYYGKSCGDCTLTLFADIDSLEYHIEKVK